MYQDIAQRYFQIENQLDNLKTERARISAQIEVYETELYALNDILCKHGKHVYGHFEEDMNNGK